MTNGIETLETIKSYILEEFLPGENADELKEDTPLISGGILDSVATLKLVAFLEECFNIRIKAHEADVENFDTLAAIGRLVQGKLQPHEQ